MTAFLAAWTFLKSPLGRALAGIVALLVVAGGIYLVGHHEGRLSVLDGLKDQRITILKDGKQIDEKVLGADDSALCSLLGGCELPDDGNH